jgi:DNA mismatch repair protein MutS
VSDPVPSASPSLTEELSGHSVASGNRSNGRGAATTAAPASGLPFQSILFAPSANADRTEVRTEPEYFPDLNLDQLLTAITAGREEYDLAPFFYEHLHDEEAIRYRQAVFRDLERPVVLTSITTFAQAMREMRGSLAQSSALRYPYQRESWFVDTVELYANAVSSLAATLADVDLDSQGLTGFRDYLGAYVRSPAFASLVAETQEVKDGFSTVDYTIQISGNRCTVAKYEGETDYSTEVLSTFDRFKQGAVKDYRVGFREPAEMNHVETNVLGLVAKLYPEPFAALDGYFSRHQAFMDPMVQRFDREVQFYVSYLEYLRRYEAVGLPFCYPTVTRLTKEVLATETFDLALATKLVSDKATVVTNDFFLKGAERIFVVSGPNQGGKTTFARMFGQLHHLGGIGYLVPGQQAQLYLYDQLFVQFEREEDLGNMMGKLEDDLVRVKEILSKATSESIVVLNEIFASTTLQDSVFLGTKVMEELIELDVLAVFVTFVEELASLAPSTVSMVSTIVPDNPAERTYKVIRRPADGLAYALAIAEKYGVTYEDLKKRVLS